LGLGEFGELGRGCPALGGEGGGGFAVGGGGFFEIRAESFENLVAVFDLGELAGDLFAEGDDFGDGLAVFPFESIDQGEAVFNFGEALGRSVDALGVVAERAGNVGDGGAS